MERIEWSKTFSLKLKLSTNLDVNDAEVYVPQKRMMKLFCELVVKIAQVVQQFDGFVFDVQKDLNAKFPMFSNELGQCPILFSVFIDISCWHLFQLFGFSKNHFNDLEFVKDSDFSAWRMFFEKLKTATGVSVENVCVFAKDKDRNRKAIEPQVAALFRRLCSKFDFTG